MIPMASVRITHQYLEFEALSLSFDFLRFHSLLCISCILTLLDRSTLAVQFVVSVESPLSSLFFLFLFSLSLPGLNPFHFPFSFSIFPFPISFIFKCSLSSFHLSCF